MGGWSCELLTNAVSRREGALDDASRLVDDAHGMMRNDLIRRSPVREAKYLVDAGILGPGDLNLMLTFAGCETRSFTNVVRLLPSMTLSDSHWQPMASCPMSCIPEVILNRSRCHLVRSFSSK